MLGFKHKNTLLTMKTLPRNFNESRVKKDFKEVLWMYDLWGRFTERKAAAKVILLADIKNGISILDVACGTGKLLENIIQNNPDGKNVGIDLSPAMLQKAEKRLNKLNQPNLELQEGNAMNLEFPDNYFDTLVNNYMVDLLPEDTFQKIADEFFRVLKPGGVLVMSTFSFGTKGIHKFWYWLAKRFPKLLTGCRPVSFEPYLIRAGFQIKDKMEVSQNTFPSQIIKAEK